MQMPSPEAGSDAGAIPDTGIVCMGEWQGQQVLGIFFFLPPDAPCFFFQVSGLFRTGGPYTYPFRYRVVKYYPVA